MIDGVVQLVAFVLQQLGIVAGVGAQAIMLVAHLREVYAPAFHEREESLYRGARHARLAALGLVIASGAVITAQTLAAGSFDVFFAPAFGGKWFLILGLLALQWLIRPQGLWRWALEGLAGAFWFAILILHIVAPQTDWGSLLWWGSLWFAAFYALWVGASAMLAGTSALPRIVIPRVTLPKMAMPGISLPKISLPRVAMPKISLPVFATALPPAHAIDPKSLPVIVKPKPAPVPVPPPATATAKARQKPDSDGLPSIRIMPQTKEEAARAEHIYA